MFEKLFSKKIAAFRFEFAPDFETNFVVSCVKDGDLSQEFATWVFNLYYAKVLYTLGYNEISESLESHMGTWAEAITAGSGFPLEVAEEMGLLVMDKDLRTSNISLGIASKDEYILEVFQKKGKWPYIRTHLSLKGYQNRLACSVLALGQNFINENKILARDIALNILLMRRYHKEIRPFTDLKAITEAPFFAIKESMEFFDEFGKELEAIEKELEATEQDK